MVKTAVRPPARRSSKRLPHKNASGIIPRFVVQAVKADAEVERFKTSAAARRFLSRILEENGWAKVVVASDAARFLPKTRGIESLEPADPAVCARADAGLVAAGFGIAATGTLVHLDTGDRDRIAWTLPPVCLCFLRAGSIVPELEDIVDRMAGHLRRGQKPGFAQVSLVTGPSRTADIEAELTLGVHGPGRLIILLYGP